MTTADIEVRTWADDLISVQLGDSLEYYHRWATPTVIVSDGGYGVLGFEGDTSDHLGLPEWYEPHVAVWSKQATPATTLWFWNSEIGWAAVHPVLEKHGWRYINANILAYRDDYERLLALKTEYDPGNFFRLNQNIEPTT